MIVTVPSDPDRPGYPATPNPSYNVHGYDPGSDEWTIEVPDPTVADAAAALLAVVAEPLLVAHAEQVTPEQAAQLAPLITPWTPGEPVDTGTLRAADHIIWEAIQAHTTQADWSPASTPALWRRWRNPDPDVAPAPWVQPTGGHDAYRLGDRVTHGGQTWTSQHDANVWEPPTFWTAD